MTTVAALLPFFLYITYNYYTAIFGCYNRHNLVWQIDRHIFSNLLRILDHISNYDCCNKHEKFFGPNKNIFQNSLIVKNTSHLSWNHSNDSLFELYLTISTSKEPLLLSVHSSQVNSKIYFALMKQLFSDLINEIMKIAVYQFTHDSAISWIKEPLR